VPIYDYLCSNCGKLTEVVHGINEGRPKFCPECGAEGTMTKAFAPRRSTSRAPAGRRRTLNRKLLEPRVVDVEEGRHREVRLERRRRRLWV
jgi:putative FmdB family regulatory protein